ncbi:unnamed protein product [Phaeothamnion confervicola]
MSKKIAQLTKVIYHLNTKNEDRQFEIDEVKASHRKEIQDILQDAAAKIQKSREAGDAKRADAAAAAVAEKLRAAHARDKERALRDFEALTEAAAVREKEILEECRGRIAALTADVSAERGKFEQTAQKLVARAADLKAQLAAARRGGDEAAEAAVARHRRELEDAVREGNQR